MLSDHENMKFLSPADPLKSHRAEMVVRCFRDPQRVFLSLLSSRHSEVSGQDHPENKISAWDLESRMNQQGGLHRIALLKEALHCIALLPRAGNTTRKV